jgi:hypothetical protein
MKKSPFGLIWSVQKKLLGALQGAQATPTVTPKLTWFSKDVYSQF